MSKNTVKSIRVHIVDDHEVVRVGLRMVFALTPDLKIVGESATKEAAVRDALRLKPDVALMDIRLPDGSGIDAAREILEACPHTRILFFTNCGDKDTVLAALVTGAQGYLLKDVATQVLIDAIGTVASGRPLLDPRVTKHTLGWLRTCFGPASLTKDDTLSPQEQRILPLVADGKTNKEIGVELTLSDKTVKNYLANIFAKLHITRRSQAAALYARRSLC